MSILMGTAKHDDINAWTKPVTDLSRITMPSKTWLRELLPKLWMADCLYLSLHGRQRSPNPHVETAESTARNPDRIEQGG